MSLTLALSAGLFCVLVFAALELYDRVGIHMRKHRNRPAGKLRGRIHHLYSLDYTGAMVARDPEVILHTAMMMQDGFTHEQVDGWRTLCCTEAHNKYRR